MSFIYDTCLQQQKIVCTQQLTYLGMQTTIIISYKEVFEHSKRRIGLLFTRTINVTICISHFLYCYISTICYLTKLICNIECRVVLNCCTTAASITWTIFVSIVYQTRFQCFIHLINPLVQFILIYCNISIHNRMCNK